MTKTDVAHLALLVLSIVFVALALTGVTMAKDAHSCHVNGGSYTVEGATAWCRY